jgi:hypothetical protein
MVPHLARAERTMSTDFQYDVFLSHNQADKPRVRRLAERLRAAGRKRKANCRRRKAAFLQSAFFLHPFPVQERSPVLFRDSANAGRRFLFWWREHPSPQNQQRGGTSSGFDLARQDSQPLLIKKNGTAKSRIDTPICGVQGRLQRAVTFSDNSDELTEGLLCLA